MPVDGALDAGYQLIIPEVAPAAIPAPAPAGTPTPDPIKSAQLGLDREEIPNTKEFKSIDTFVSWERALRDQSTRKNHDPFWTDGEGRGVGAIGDYCLYLTEHFNRAESASMPDTSSRIAHLLTSGARLSDSKEDRYLDIEKPEYRIWRERVRVGDREFTRVRVWIISGVDTYFVKDNKAEPGALAKIR